jgi:hypothetical protein
MTIKDIVKEWLDKHGYDGLYTIECGCFLDDLMPCDTPDRCKPGVRRKGEFPYEDELWIGPPKEENE